MEYAIIESLICLLKINLSDIDSYKNPIEQAKAKYIMSTIKLLEIQQKKLSTGQHNEK